MNKLLAVFGILSVSGSVAFAQIRVGAGESWSYGFTSLARLGPEEVLLGAFYGGANLAMSSVAPGTHYTISIYENSLSDVPIWVTDSLVTPTTGAGGRMIWQDLQGWAQVQVITGALTIDQIQFDAEIPIDDTHVYHYKSMIPVGPVVPQSNTVTFPSGLSLAANPLSAGLTNGANEIGLLIDGETISTWNGLGFETYAYHQVSNSWSDGGAHPTSAPSLPPGKGFFFFNPGPTTNITFKGLLTPGPGVTNAIQLQRGYSLVGSMVPATVTNITSAPVNLPLIDGMIVVTWSGSNYVYTSYDSGFGGWVDANYAPVPAPSYSTGQGFFLFNPQRGPAVWVQSLP